MPQPDATPVQFWKETLRPGRYRLSDGRVVTYKPNDSAAAAATGKKMLAAGLRVPVCWEHDPDANPVALSHANAWLARGYAGEARDYRVGADGVLETLVEAASPEDAERMKRIRTVSPRVNYDFTDEEGVLWPGVSLGHIAVTAMPVQRRQKPVDFGRVVTGTVRPHATDTHDLSLATPVSTDMAEPNETDAAAAGAGDMKAVLKWLKLLGINPGDASNLADLGTRLEAIATHQGADADQDGDGVPDGAEPGPAPSALMSWLDSRAKIEAGDFERRIERLEGTRRVPAAVADKLRGELKAADLSRASYSLKTYQLKPLPLAAKLDAYEALPEPPDLTRRSRLTADLGRVVPADAVPVKTPKQVTEGDKPDASKEADEAATLMEQLAQPRK